METEPTTHYWLISNIVFDLACNYELKHRISGQDFRRLLFSKKIELMQKVNPQWAEKKKQEIKNILAEHPYDDEV